MSTMSSHAVSTGEGYSTTTPTAKQSSGVDLAGRVERQGRAHAVAASNEGYDAKGRVVGLQQSDANGNTIAHYDYVYDFAGEVAQQTDHGLTTNYSYNLRGELTAKYGA
jgi:hypothetical protein